MIFDSEEDYLAHYGVLRRSGRYPWGSGGPEYASNRGFLGYVGELKKQGLSDVEISKAIGITTTQLRAAKSIARNEEAQADINMAQRLRDKGYSNVEIAKRMTSADRKIGESQVRALLQPGKLDKLQILNATTDVLREAVAKKGFIDIGSGSEYNMGISSKKLSDAVHQLQEEGYTKHWIKVDQLGTNHQTTLKVLAAPDTPWSEVEKNKDKISQPVERYSTDGGRTYNRIQPPIQVDPKRVAVRYAEEGGAHADGVIYVRPGVHDLSMGSAHYAQVRIAVGGTHYLKGMAMYKDDLPEGTDLLFNTNKSNTGNKLDAMKPLKIDKVTGEIDATTGGFGSIVRQLPKLDEHGNEVKGSVRSAMNIVNEEGNWDEWNRSLSSQFLSKQSPALAKSQLDITFEKSKGELDGIKSLTNPVVKKKLLQSYADGADAAAVHLKAAALPNQRTQVILPITTMKPNEVYAPNFHTGDKVVLIRHPHGGTFEIPELTVNNNHPEAKKLLGNAEDAIGIHHSVAEKLSGADFDGDTVLVIPNNHGRIKHDPMLTKLKGFDPRAEYKEYEGMPRMTPRQKGLEMGKISNLITDMTIRGASTDELARAVRHSMVVIDAEKHNLNYRQSARDHGIPALQEKYQGKKGGGAKTLISRSGSKSTVAVPERKQNYKIDPVTGKKIFTETGASYVVKEDKFDKNGKRTAKAGDVVIKTEKVTRLGNEDDAHNLSSGTPIEKIYADHSNKMKALGDEARLALEHTKTNPYSPSAAKVYAEQVKTLTAKLNLALENSPRERRAQILANAAVAAKRAANPDMDAAELKKTKYLELEHARLAVGARKEQIEIEDKEWAAIQAGAISNKKLSDILDNADLDKIKVRAMPQTHEKLTPAMKQRAETMLSSGKYTQAAVASQLGISLSTLKRELSGGGNG